MKTTEKGQTLVTLLFFMIIGVTIASATVIIIMVNSLGATNQQQGIITYYVAESGIEDVLMRLLRNPTYSSYSPETLSVGQGTAIVTITGGSGNPYTIISQGTLGSFMKKIQVTATFTNNVLNVTSWREIF